jgi:hypothetical protein
MFLTRDELAELTGRRRPSLQIAWLRENRVPFRINASKHPVVCRSAVEDGERSSRKPWMPDFTHLEKTP